MTHREPAYPRRKPERLSKMLECRIKDAAGGLSIAAVQNVNVEDRPDDEQYGHNSNHWTKIAERA